MSELADVLVRHWLVSIGCDHVRNTDSPVCSCSLVALGTFESVGQAVRAWAEHVEQVMSAMVEQELAQVWARNA